VSSASAKTRENINDNRHDIQVSDSWSGVCKSFPWLSQKISLKVDLFIMMKNKTNNLF
jgi:hypothetical protein